MAGIDPQKKVPALFNGSGEHILPKNYGPYRDGSGNQWKRTIKNASTGFASFGIVPGDSIMVFPHEVYGQTYWHDPRGILPSQFIGIGHVVKPEDAGRTKEELLNLGYEFHGKSALYEPVIAFDDLLAQGEPQATIPTADETA